MRKLLYTSFYLASVLSSFGANHYIRDGASGANDGSNWTDAWDDLPATLTRGDTYYIADGTYANYDFDDAESGTTVITIKKATAGDHGAETGWSSTYGDGVATFSSENTVFDIETDYWVIDGVVGDGDGSTTAHGIKIEHTSTVSGRYGINIFSGADNITLTRMEITSTQGSSVATGDSQSGIRSTGSSNNDFSYLYIHDWKTNCIIMTNSSDTVVEHSYFYRSHSTATAHGQAIYLGFTSADSWDIRYNIFHDINGSGVIFLSGACSDIRVYGNLFWEEWEATDYGQFSVSGVINHNNTHGDVTGLRFMNNTLIDMDGTGTAGNILIDSGSDNIAKNNILIGCNWTEFQTTTEDYNAADEDLGETNDQLISSSIFTNYAGGDFSLSEATDDGDDSIGATYNTDILGNTRDLDGVWDRGAYEFSAGGSGSAYTGQLRLDGSGAKPSLSTGAPFKLSKIDGQTIAAGGGFTLIQENNDESGSGIASGNTLTATKITVTSGGPFSPSRVGLWRQDAATAGTFTIAFWDHDAGNDWPNAALTNGTSDSTSYTATAAEDWSYADWSGSKPTLTSAATIWIVHDASSLTGTNFFRYNNTSPERVMTSTDGGDTWSLTTSSRGLRFQIYE